LGNVQREPSIVPNQSDAAPTMIDLLVLMDPDAICPDNPLYGAVVTRNVCSSIFSFHAKLWQLRSIYISSSNEWRLFPFILNTGGVPWNYPILCDRTIAMCGLDPTNYRRSLDASYQLVTVPQPFKPIRAPLSTNWDDDRVEKARKKGPEFDPVLNPRFNMLGGEVVLAIGAIHLSVCSKLTADTLDDDAINSIVQLVLDNYSAQPYGADDFSVREEIKAQIIGRQSQKQGCTWTANTLPILDQYFVR
jgi:hypothetical protein